MLNAGQKYCRMLQREHSAILSTFITLPFIIKIFVLSIFEWPLKTGFTVDHLTIHKCIETLINRIFKSNSVDPDDMLLLAMPHLSAIQLLCTFWNNLSFVLERAMCIKRLFCPLLLKKKKCFFSNFSL